jgi:predicted GNAT family acetyltransferase
VNAPPTIVLADNPDQRRYEVRVEGKVAGFAQYRVRPGQITFTHTEVDDRFEGQGLGSKLVAFALDDVRKRGLTVIPLCPFVRAYIQRHPESADVENGGAAPTDC